MMKRQCEAKRNRLMRFTKEDKRRIADAQWQYKYERDECTGQPYLVGYRCRRCNKVLTRLSDLEVDHIKARSKGGSNRPSNLQLLCPECNKKKSNKVGERLAHLQENAALLRGRPPQPRERPARLRENDVKSCNNDFPLASSHT
jgi:5-methylcytosine-specific restriction endonuclease McrA